MKTVKKIANAKKSIKKNLKNAATVIKKDVKETTKQAKEAVKKEAKIVSKESRRITTELENRWKDASTEERIFTLLGVIFLIIGLYLLRDMIIGLVVVSLGLLFITGYFIKKTPKLPKE